MDLCSHNMTNLKIFFWLGTHMIYTFVCLFVCLFVCVPSATVMYLNCMSVSWTARLQIFLTGCKLLAMAIIIIPGFYQLYKGVRALLGQLHYNPNHPKVNH